MCPPAPPKPPPFVLSKPGPNRGPKSLSLAAGSSLAGPARSRHGSEIGSQASAGATAGATAGGGGGARGGGGGGAHLPSLQLSQNGVGGGSAAAAAAAADRMASHDVNANSGRLPNIGGKAAAAGGGGGGGKGGGKDGAAAAGGGGGGGGGEAGDDSAALAAMLGSPEAVWNHYELLNQKYQVGAGGGSSRHLHQLLALLPTDNTHTHTHRHTHMSTHS